MWLLLITNRYTETAKSTAKSSEQCIVLATIENFIERVKEVLAKK